MAPRRKIASNLLWTPEGVVRNPLVRISAEGRVAAIECCAEIDREPMTEFYAGMLVADFDTDYREAFARLCHRADVPLTELLPEVITPGKGVLVVLSGIDYRTMRPTPQARIERLA